MQKLDPNNQASQWPSISGISEAHAQGIKGQGVLMGILDTGVDADHQEFSKRTIDYRYVNPASKSERDDHDVRGFDPDRRNHGTQVCGVIAGNNVGIAPEVDLYVASVIESETTYTTFMRVMRGLDWLIEQFQAEKNKNKPAILNMSLLLPSFASFTPSSEIPTPEALQFLINDLHAKIIKLIEQANVLPVASMGNRGIGQYNYPGAFKEVLGVGAIDFEGRRAEFSGSGQPSENLIKPDAVGYGVDVYTSFKRDYSGTSLYQKAGGTTISSAYVAGIAALYRCQQPNLTVDEIRTKILQNAFELENEPSDRVGVGLVRFI